MGQKKRPKNTRKTYIRATQPTSHPTPKPRKYRAHKQARNHKKFHPQPPNTRRFKSIYRGSKNTSRRPLKTRFLHQVRQRFKPHPRQPI